MERVKTIVETRRKLALSRSELARRAGISRVSLWLVETGRVVEPRVTTLLALKEALCQAAKKQLED